VQYASVGVAPILDRMRINRSRWFGHVMGDSGVVRVVNAIYVESNRRRVRPEKR